ncbi:hypothetical protein GQ53DRAFT_733010 [Thozetella sp. PMI_491]|nr:hypothetical protein GQ53DRAFT_733010 [Thozetella sp. PMI_491]
MDNFSDDGFDDLNDLALQELEDNAIQFTQANHLRQTQASQVAPHYGLGDDDLDDTVVIDELAHKPARPAAPTDKPLPPQQTRPLPPTFAGQQRWSQQVHQPNAPYGARQQYPAPPRGGPVAPLAPPPPPGASQRFPTRPAPPQASQLHRPPPSSLRPHAFQSSQALGAAGGDSGDNILNTLKARLAVLQSELNSAKGEASILRAKYDKSQASHDAEVARLKKQNAEQIANKERQVEAAVAAERNAATELEFTRQDLKEELGRAKSKKREPVTTPKKTKKWEAGDGFDDIEILPSPSKGQGQRRRDPGPVATSVAERTPSKGKRKRPAFDSPINALEIHSEDAALFDTQSTKSPDVARVDLAKANAFHDFHKLVMAHGSHHGHPLTFDLFARYALPSDSARSFASVLIQELACMGEPKNPLDLLVEFCNLIIDLWARSLAERYYAPIYDLAALVFFTLQLNAIDVAPRIIHSLVPLAEDTCVLVAQPRSLGDAADLSADIDVTQCLFLIYLSALGCVGAAPLEVGTSDDATGAMARIDCRAELWRCIRVDFLMIMISTKQQEADFLGTLALLCTSVFPDSIGPIPPPALTAEEAAAGIPLHTPESVGKSLVNQVSLHLTEPLPWAAPGSAKLCEGRLSVIRTLQAFAASSFGAMFIASSAIAIPRLVTTLSWAIDRLYDMDASQEWDVRELLERNISNANPDGTEEPTNPNSDPDGTQAMDVDEKAEDEKVPAPAPTHTRPRAVFNPNIEPNPSPLLFQIISQGILLLHTLITHPQTSGAANIATKLVGTHGGSQRYQLMLARLNFAEEDLVLEAGVDAETMELAHELLELFVTPEDGEAVGEVFGV